MKRPANYRIMRIVWMSVVFSIQVALFQRRFRVKLQNRLFAGVISLGAVTT
ncbi:hypothetical protein [Sporosarcina sp. FA9]|uniref:hypothetical protein n=1 Tax=Sporosarcina sp. FA9 TaxID=3413030 RepID=UPI003F6586CB